jgi:hypothetical protein
MPPGLIRAVEIAISHQRIPLRGRALKAGLTLKRLVPELRSFGVRVESLQDLSRVPDLGLESESRHSPLLLWFRE